MSTNPIAIVSADSILCTFSFSSVFIRTFLSVFRAFRPRAAGLYSAPFGSPARSFPKQPGRSDKQPDEEPIQDQDPQDSRRAPRGAQRDDQREHGEPRPTQPPRGTPRATPAPPA